MTWKTLEQARVYNKKYKKKNPEKVKAYEKSRREKRKNCPKYKKWLKEWIIKRRAFKAKYIRNYKKKIGKCINCGWNKETDILQFHHREPKDKSFTFSKVDLANFAKEKIDKEFLKCDLLCPNCHMLLEYKKSKVY